MKLKITFYQMIQEDWSLQLRLLTYPILKHQDVDSLYSMAQVKHSVFTRPEIRKCIVKHHNSFLPESDHITEEQLLAA